MLFIFSRVVVALGFSFFLLHDFLTKVVYNTMTTIREDFRLAQVEREVHVVHKEDVRRVQLQEGALARQPFTGWHLQVQSYLHAVGHRQGSERGLRRGPLQG